MTRRTLKRRNGEPRRLSPALANQWDAVESVYYTAQIRWTFRNIHAHMQFLLILLCFCLVWLRTTNPQNTIQWGHINVRSPYCIELPGMLGYSLFSSWITAMHAFWKRSIYEDFDSKNSRLKLFLSSNFNEKKVLFFFSYVKSCVGSY